MDKLKKAFFGLNQSYDEIEYGFPTNLSCIAAVESEKYLMILADQKITKIKRSLIFEKKSGFLMSEENLKSFKIVKKINFSLFMGITMFKEQVYLIFAGKVSKLRFGNKDIYTISSVSAFSLHKMTPNIDMSIVLTEYYKDKFIFSYEMDMTDSGNYKAAFNKEYNPFKYKKNFVFYANTQMLSNYLSSKYKSWLIPIVFGKLIHEKINIDELITHEIYFLYKSSVFDLNKDYCNDQDLFDDFFCPTSFSTVDTFVIENGELKSFGAVFNSFPGQYEGFKSKNKNDFFSDKISERQILKFYEFMHYFLHVSNYVLGGDKKMIEILKSVEERIKQDPSAKHLLNNIIVPKSDYYKDLLLICDSLSDHLSFTDLFASVLDINNRTPFISFCTQYAFSDYIECFYHLYLNLIIGKSITKIEQEEHKKRFSNNGEGLAKQKKSYSQLKKVIRQLFDADIKRCDTVINLQEYIKSNMKEYNIRIPVEAVRADLYGAEDVISTNYKRVLNENFLPVFTTKPMTMTILTHNCAGVDVTETLIEQIHYQYLETINGSDLIVIGLQEIIEMKSRNWNKIISNNNKEQLSPWVKAFCKIFEEFRVITYVSLVGLFLIVLGKKELINSFDITIPHADLIKLGAMKLANKGGVFINLKINYERFGFFNCHLAAGTKPKNYIKRQKNLNELVEYFDKTENLSVAFIIGDMNFRTKIEYEDALHLITGYINESNPKKYQLYIDDLLKTDELTHHFKMMKGTALDKFVEVPISFLPSYKWEADSSVYDYKGGKRTPSW